MRLPRTRSGLPSRGVLFDVFAGLLATAAATAVRAALDPFLGDSFPYVFYVVAVVLATWHGGRVGGVVSFVSGALAANYFFVPPRFTLAFHAVEWRIALFVFAGVSAVLMAIAFRWRHVQAALMQAQAVLAQAGQMARLGAWAIEYTDRDDLDANPLYWSDETYRIFGYRPQAVPASNALFFSLVHPEDRPRVVDAVAQAMATRSPYSVEHRIIRPDGVERVVLEHAEIEFDAAGRPCWMVGAVQDVTDRKRVEEALRASEETARRRTEELEQLTEQLEEANRLKDEFIATVSHELRTPLNAMLGWVQLLRERRLDGSAEERALSVIANNARRQAQLIEDLLDMSRVIAGRLRLEPRLIEAQGPVHAAIEAILPGAAAKGIDVRGPADAAGVHVLADAARLQQVVWNLLTNAVKFTPAGGSVSVDIRPCGADVDIVVSDTGVGIPPEFLPHVFDRFRQADSRTTRAHGGLGIGLSIVQHLVEAQGGRVRAESMGTNRGATFIVTLPLKTVEAGARPALEQAGGHVPDAGAAHAKPSPDLHGIRVLAVDDEPDSRDLAQAVLSQYGADVETAESARAALGMLHRWRPDVLLIDIAMPEMDGFALLQRIRDPGRGGEPIPAIALTAYARAEDRERALANGFQAYLTKPVEEKTLARAVAAQHARQMYNRPRVD